ncbi:MAG: regulatory protein RecX [Pseudomonadota bacterium]
MSQRETDSLGGENKKGAQAVRRSAINMLARREHSSQELRRKLGSKGFDDADVDEALAGLRQDRLQSDERFIESLVRSRIGKGCGPLRIQAELRERGIAEELIAQAMDVDAGAWRERIEEVRRKRFGVARPGDMNERARQMRFLQYRGFTTEQIRSAMRRAGDDVSD